MSLLLTRAGSGSAPLPLADGWWYVTNTDTPTLSGAVSGPNLHDGTDPDTSTGYANALGNADFLAIYVKAAGITFDELHASPGYNNTLTVTWYGSNDGVNFTPISVSSPAFSVHVVFGYTNYQWTCSTQTYRIVVQHVNDSGGNALSLQAGCADLRLFNLGSEVS